MLLPAACVGGAGCEDVARLFMLLHTRCRSEFVLFIFRQPLPPPLSPLFCIMGKEQELLEAARIGNVAVVEKLLSGKKGLLGSGSGSIPLSSLLRMYKGLVVKL